MATLGRSPGAAPLTSADIPDNSITSAKIVAGTVETSDLSDGAKINTNLAILAFRTATNASGIKFNLQDQVIDEYGDATGVDASPSTNHTLTAGVYSGSTATSAALQFVAKGGGGGGYEGNAGSSGGSGGGAGYAGAASASTQALQSGDSDVGNFGYGNTGGSGEGATGGHNPAGGGGASAAGVNGISTGGSATSGPGGAGYDGTAVWGTALGDNGYFAGGGGGGYTTNTPTVGNGAGGTGGGGNGGSSVAIGVVGEPNTGGGSGGGGNSSGQEGSGAGGSGVVLVRYANSGFTTPPTGGNSTDTSISGYTILVFTADGTLTVTESGDVSFLVVGGGGSGGNYYAGGGGGGGLVYKPTHAVTANTYSIVVGDGGAGKTSSSTGSQGNNGEDSTVTLDAGSTPANLTLQSTDTEAEAQPTKADMVMLMEDAAGTATINTNIKGFISRDSGTTFTEGTLVDEGDWGTNKRILAFHDLDISSQPADKTMCYKITTHNQAAGLQTKIHATSIGWR